jgi:hypothetical protein
MNTVFFLFSLLPKKTNPEKNETPKTIFSEGCPIQGKGDDYCKEEKKRLEVKRSGKDGPAAE